MSERSESVSVDPARAVRGNSNSMEEPDNAGATSVDAASELGHSFLRIANLPNYVLDRLSRYEIALSRQVD
jgi:hypothetical protein